MSKKVSVSQFSMGEGRFIKRFDSVTQAEEATDIPQGNIIHACKGTNKSAGGYIWKYSNLNGVV